MKTDSIKEAINVIIDALDNTTMDQTDKVELELNLYKFLDNYEKNIKVLNKSLRSKYENNSSSK